MSAPIFPRVRYNWSRNREEDRERPHLIRNQFPVYLSFRNVPSSSSSNACRSCSCVFITMGPYHATGSSSGFPETSRKRMPSSPACTINFIAAVKENQRAVVRLRGRVGVQPSHRFGGHGERPRSVAEFPIPEKTYAKA